MVVSKRAWNMHNKKRKAASLEGGPTTGVKINPATVKNPSWVTAGSAKPVAKPFTGKVNISAPSSWMSMTGQPLKKVSKKHKK